MGILRGAVRIVCLNFLSGYKTYLLGGAFVLKGIVEFIEGGDGWEHIMQGIGLWTVRKAIKT